MRPLTRLGSLWRGLFERARMDAELDEELTAYFDELVARKQAQGHAPDAARHAARREMGAPQQIKQAVREAWLVSSWDGLVQDVRHAWRGLRSTPAMSALAVATFAIGIGSVAAILSVVQATLLTPPPYRDPSRLVMVWADLTTAGFPRAPLSGPELRDLRLRTSSFEGFAGVWANSITLTQAGERVRAHRLRDRGLLPAARRRAGGGPPAGTRGRGGRRAGDDPAELRAVAAALRGRPRGRRARDHGQRPAVDRGRRAAVRLPPAAPARRGDARHDRGVPALPLADRRGAARAALPARDRAREAGREPRAGAPGRGPAGRAALE
jgi:hypothetical protein